MFIGNFRLMIGKIQHTSLSKRQPRIVHQRASIFMLRYALMPSTVFRHPDAVYTVTSPEFLVTG
jgi:hypothetical protein